MADLSEYYQITPSAGVNGYASGQAPQSAAPTAPAGSNLGATFSGSANASSAVLLAVALLAGVFVFLHFRDD